MTATRARVPKVEPTEADMRGTIRDAANQFGWRMHFHWLSKHSPKGWPDVVLVRPPVLVVVELKRERTEVTVDQRAWLWDLAASGVEVWVVRPSCLDRFLQRMARRP